MKPNKQIFVPVKPEDIRMITQRGSLHVVRNDGNFDIILGRMFGILFVKGEVIGALV